MRVFLSGPMGSGKSTVAQALAAASGMQAFDLDHVIEQATGKSVSQLFAERDEPAFRALERDQLRALLARHAQGVFALGGGTVVDRALRRELLREGLLVGLYADRGELLRRLGQGEGRPLLAGQDVGSRLDALLEARAEAYAECHLPLDTSREPPEALARAILRALEHPPILVPLGTRSYRVEVGSGIRGRLAEHAAGLRPSRVLLVSNDVVGPLWADPLAAQLRSAGMPLGEVRLPDGEEHKTLASVERIWEAALSAGVDRSSLVIAVGGGVVGDLAGFAAATLLRGIRAGHVPTTLLSMVDAAVGGKTGFDTRHGKNLIGAFHQPSFVLCDVEVLASLPEPERRSGLAEVVKSAWIEGEAAVAELERDARGLLAGAIPETLRAIQMSVAMKARVVTEDERETGQRALLNLGHTVGHAIEAAQGYRGIRHGEAVALGMVAAFRLAERLGEAPRGQLARLTALLAALGLPTAVEPYLRPEVLSFIGADKKRRSDKITFVLPGGPGAIGLRPLAVADLPGLLGA